MHCHSQDYFLFDDQLNIQIHVLNVRKNDWYVNYSFLDRNVTTFTSQIGNVSIIISGELNLSNEHSKYALLNLSYSNPVRGREIDKVTREGRGVIL